MLESQGTRPLDPYRTLQLHPRASRELVAETYWHLVSRRKQRGEAENVSDLSAAYGLLMNDARRAAYDDEHGLVPALGTAGRAQAYATGLTYYELLGIDREADAEIVSLAHTVLMRVHDRPESGALRDAIDEAFRTLRNPQLRAQYEAWLAGSAASVSPAPVVAVPAAVAVRDAEPARTGPLSSPAAEVTGITAIASAPPDERRPVETSERPSGLLRRLGVGRSSKPAMRATYRPARRFDSEQALNSAKDERLLTLQSGPWEEDAADLAYVSPGPGDAEGEARLTFIAGAFAGQRVGLNGDVVTIGSAPESDLVLSDPVGRVAPEHACIWKQGERFAFRQCEGARTVIGGQRLVTAVVMLDDGDEIQIGPHRMTFSLVERSPAGA